MNRANKIIAVTLVTAFIFILAIFPASAADTSGDVFTPTTSYPYAESLVYGSDTVVIDINYNAAYPDYYFYRYQVSEDSIFWVTRNYSSGKYYYTLNIASNDPIYSYVINTSSGYNGTVATFNQGSSFGYTYWHYDTVSFSNDYTFKCRATMQYQEPTNLSLGSGVVLIVNTIWTYPTLTQIQNEENYNRLSNQINEGFTVLDNRLEQGFQGVEEAITNAAGEIINAGSDMPTLDTNNDWMNDSLTKVNEWVSQLEAFEEQMKAAEAENSSNMAQAEAFINGFFEKVPKAITAVLTLFLVIIVVVKVIGR